MSPVQVGGALGCGGLAVAPTTRASSAATWAGERRQASTH